MPPTSVITLTESSRGAACICCACPIGAAIIAGALKLEQSSVAFNIIMILGFIVGIVLAISVMQGYWSGFK